MWDRLWIDVSLATDACGTGRPGGDDFGAIRDGAIAAKDGVIAWVGSRSDLPAEPASLAVDVISCHGQWMTTGLVDPHTHLVFGGDRSGEFAERLQGVSYQDIARRGGGILSTVRATRAASEEELLRVTLGRVRRLIENGATTIEIKSGYGLTTEEELKQLRVARAVGRHLPVRVHTTFLGAHALPPEFAGRQADYVTHLCEDMIPAVAEAGLADSVDAFCETIAFKPVEIERIFETARSFGLPLRLHADQMSDLQGSHLAARWHALSADHVEYANEESVRAMAEAGTVAMLLPGAFWFVREEKLPPVALFRKHGVPMGLATDCNPGTSPILTPTGVMNMACILFRLTPGEALAGHTHIAAKALGLAETAGRLRPGMAADMVLWDVAGPHELSYWIGGVKPSARIFAGIPD
ncbi:imidazolonepropionase [Acetobacter oeni]|uniref:Imidazolonepropionase n=1 Tax=Acetobacter oeni TaxID=304077 RepID=A0A511XPK9_9PROT|nr:imidazolonepropionase [Acetobacter oeni]MBB3884622.1 imidazolonepropionase [Acetobacter oeni]NHO20569.1 imidazolonepropionase [Acetobacter oeni]GBR05048.1 imidazolonepropionase [Acetobacter oeni LMG 21952]GEN64839.1 imidazolonepropionase [Acetobacter oeni]